MYKKAIANISAYYKQRLIDSQNFADTHPDDPLLTFDTHDINDKDYQQFTMDKMTFVDVSSNEQLNFTTWLPLAYKMDLENEQAFIKTEDDKYQAQSIDVSKLGLCVQGNNRWFTFRPILFEWEQLKHLLSDGFILRGQDASTFWQACWQEVMNYQAEITILAIRRNPDILSFIREQEPYLLDYQGIKHELVEAFRQKRITEPKSTRGQKHQITQNIFELYHFVYFYRFQGMTLEEACWKTVETHKHLLPDDWSNPDETLKKRVTRMDKYQKISQSAGFKAVKSKK